MAVIIEISLEGRKEGIKYWVGFISVGLKSLGGHNHHKMIVSKKKVA